MDLSKLGMNHKIAAGGGLLALISMFLPWYGISFGSIGGVSINAWSAGFFAWGGLTLAIIGAVILVLKALEVRDVTAGSVGAEKLALVLSGTGTVFVLLRFLTETSFVKLGLFLGIISVVAVAYGAYAAMSAAKREVSA